MLLVKQIESGDIIMTMAKRQIVLGALILALGAAVYLNWQFTSVVPTDDTVSVDTDVTDYEKTENLGVAELVNSSYMETVTDEIITDSTVLETQLSNILSETRLAQQETRDEALEVLSSIIESDTASTDVVQEAVDKTTQIAQDMLDETAAETLLIAKGIEDVVVYINDGECNVLVDGLDGNSLIIQDVLCNQIGIDIDSIHIIEIE